MSETATTASWSTLNELSRLTGIGRVILKNGLRCVEQLKLNETNPRSRTLYNREQALAFIKSRITKEA